MIPVTGGPIVRLEEIGGYHNAVWSEDGTSIYYFSSAASNGTLRRYDLGTGRSELLTDESWELWRLPLAISRADGNLYFISNQGFARVDPETGFAEVVSEERFDSFDLSPDGRRAVGVKEGDLTLINLEFLSSGPLQVSPGAMDALELGQIPAARERWIASKLRPDASVSALLLLASQARKAIGVHMVRWVDNERLWCVVEEDKSTDPTRSDPEVRMGIAQLY